MTLPSDETHYLLTLDEVRARALVAVDVATLNRITGEDYVHVESSGKRRNKAEFIDGLRHGEYRFDSFTIDENSVSIYGDTAVLTGSYHNDIRTDAGLQPAKYARHIRVYVRRGDDWVNVAHQATAITVGSGDGK